MGYFTFVTGARRWIRRKLKRGLVKEIQETIKYKRSILTDIKGSYLYYLDEMKKNELLKPTEFYANFEHKVIMCKEYQLQLEQEIEVLKQFDKAI